MCFFGQIFQFFHQNNAIRPTLTPKLCHTISFGPFCIFLRAHGCQMWPPCMYVYYGNLKAHGSPDPLKMKLKKCGFRRNWYTFIFILKILGYFDSAPMYRVNLVLFCPHIQIGLRNLSLVSRDLYMYLKLLSSIVFVIVTYFCFVKSKDRSLKPLS